MNGWRFHMSKKILLIAIISVFCGVSFASAQIVPLKSHMDSVSYALGCSVGKNFSDNIKRDSLGLNIDILAQSLVTSLKGNPTQMPDSVVAKVMAAFQQDRTEAMQKKTQEAGNANKKKGEEFLAKNKLDKDVKVTASGLQYKAITMGKGPKPAATDKVKVHYHGTLIDGKVFDSSVERNEPITFPLNGVIPGWTEGVQLMPVGSKFKFFIPSSLAYGDRGAPPSIGPNETLIFEVELLNIEKPDEKGEKNRRIIVITNTI